MSWLRRPCRCVCHSGHVLHPVGELCCPEAATERLGGVEPGQHRPYVDDRHGGFRVLCDCGWRSELLSLRADARLELEAHERRTQPRTEPSIWDRTAG